MFHFICGVVWQRHRQIDATKNITSSANFGGKKILGRYRQVSHKDLCYNYKYLNVIAGIVAQLIIWGGIYEHQSVNEKTLAPLPSYMTKLEFYL